MTEFADRPEPRISSRQFAIFGCAALLIVVLLLVFAVSQFTGQPVRHHNPSFDWGMKVRVEDMTNGPYGDLDAACRWALKDPPSWVAPAMSFNLEEAVLGCKYEDKSWWPW